MNLNGLMCLRSWLTKQTLLLNIDVRKNPQMCCTISRCAVPSTAWYRIHYRIVWRSNLTLAMRGFDWLQGCRYYRQSGSPYRQAVANKSALLDWLTPMGEVRLTWYKHCLYQRRCLTWKQDSSLKSASVHTFVLYELPSCIQPCIILRLSDRNLYRGLVIMRYFGLC